MEIKHRLTFRTVADEALISLLEQHKIKYKFHPDIECLIIEILESHPCWHEMQKYLNASDLDEGIVSAVYTKREMADAQWFALRSKWRWEYPQPQSDCFGYMKNTTYAEGSACKECGCNAEQIGNFRVRKSPAWNAKNFLMLNWEDDVLFMSDNARSVLESSGLRGFGFREVCNSKGTAKIADINQLVIDKHTESGLVLKDTSLVKEIHICSTCNSVKYVMAGRGIWYKESALPDDVDIVKSCEYFGWGHSSSNLIFVRRSIYDLIVRNKLDRQLEFRPVFLV